MKNNDFIDCFDLKDERNTTEINIKLIFELSRDQEMNKIYKQIDLEKCEDEKELSMQQRLMPVTEENLLKLLSK